MTVRLISAWVAGAVLAALYVYATIAAIGNLFGMGQFLGEALGVLPWALLGIGVIIPAIAFVLSFVVAHGRSAWVKVLVLASGLCLAAAVQLEIMHLIS